MSAGQRSLRLLLLLVLLALAIAVWFIHRLEHRRPSRARRGDVCFSRPAPRPRRSF